MTKPKLQRKIIKILYKIQSFAFCLISFCEKNKSFNDLSISQKVQKFHKTLVRRKKSFVISLSGIVRLFSLSLSLFLVFSRWLFPWYIDIGLSLFVVERISSSARIVHKHAERTPRQFWCQSEARQKKERGTTKNSIQLLNYFFSLPL